MTDRGSAAALGTEGIRIKARHENFPVASRLLPKDTRRHLMAIYGFARLTDDVGDEAAGDRLLLLDRLEAELERSFAGRAEHPVFRELGETITACRLEKRPFLDLIEANRQDQLVSRYESYEQLRGYCRLSAEPVGRLVLAVGGVLTPERAAWSDDVCTGLQLTEHWQDVAEDAGRGRIYLPREDLDKFGVRESDLLARKTTPEFARLMAFEVDRAQSLLAAVRPLAGSLRGRLRVAVIGFAAGGLATTDAIRAADYDVLSRAIRGGKGRLFMHSLRLLMGARAIEARGSEGRGAPAEAAPASSPQAEWGESPPL